MAEDRSQPGAAATDAELHDDDELAAVLAAELQRYATGAVPMVAAGAPRPAGTPVPTSAPAPRRTSPPVADPVTPEDQPRTRAAARAASAPPIADTAPRPAPVAAGVPPAPRSAGPATEPAPTRRLRTPERTPQDTFAARVAEVQREYPDAAAIRRDAEQPEAQTGRRAAAVPPGEDAEPVRRRSGFRPPQPAQPSAPVPAETQPQAFAPAPTEPQPSAPVSARPQTPGAERPVVADPPPRTGPMAAAEAAGDDPAGSEAGRRGRARHAAPLDGPESAPPSRARADAGQHATGQHATDQHVTGQHRLGRPAVPETLYEDWEQSLRAIGRPGGDLLDDDDPVPGAPVDAPTVALTVPPRSDADSGRPHVLPAAEPDATDGPPGRTARRRRAGRRSAAPADAEPPTTADPIPDPSPPIAAAGEAASPVLDDGAGDDEGIDEVATMFPERSAGDTAALELPSMEPRPRTAPVLIERVRTALLALPVVPPSPTGTGAAAILGRWVGAFASPLLLVVGFGLAAAGAGPASIVALVLGGLLALPAAARASAWAATEADGAALLETTVLGRRAGRAFGAVLLLTRLVAAALLLVAVADLAGAYVTRTGVLGGNPANAAVIAVVVVGGAALAVSVWPHRVTGVLVLLLGAVGALVTVIVLLLVGPAATGPASAPSSGGPVIAGTVAFAAVGLLLLLVAADLVRWRTDLPRPIPAVVATVLSVALGVGVLAVAVLVANGSGATGDGADAFVGAVVDATATPLAAPLAIALLAAMVTLPALVLRSTGDAAVRLLGGGPRSAGLATLSAALLAIAAALGAVAAGLDAPTLAIVVGAVLGVPLAAWAGVLTTAPLRDAAPSRGALLGVLVVAVLVGWALADGLGVAGERSPLLDALHLAGAWRGGPAVGLAAALVLGVVGGLIARIARGTAPRRAAAGAVDGAAEPVASVAE